MKKALLILAVIISIPLAFFEYVALFWIWGGDGSFTLYTTPIVFVLYSILHIVAIKKFKDMWIAKTILKFSAILITPVLSAALTVFWLAEILGITIFIA